MLPGLRFLFAAIVLSISMLVFGLGAAALLRAAREDLASIPSRRAPPETMFAQRGQAEPTLALVRIEAPEPDRKAAVPPQSDDVQDLPAIVSTAAEAEKPTIEPDQAAALDTEKLIENSPPSDAAATEPAAVAVPIETETPAAQADDTASPAAAIKIAAIAEIAPEAPEQNATAKPDQPNTPIDDSTRIAETRIATVGSLPVTIETPSRIAPAAVKKSAQARRVVKRHRIAQRARPTQRAAQRPADPFAQPFGR